MFFWLSFLDVSFRFLLVVISVCLLHLCFVFNVEVASDCFWFLWDASLSWAFFTWHWLLMFHFVCLSGSRVSCSNVIWHYFVLCRLHCCSIQVPQGVALASHVSIGMAFWIPCFMFQWEMALFFLSVACLIFSSSLLKVCLPVVSS